MCKLASLKPIILNDCLSPVTPQQTPQQTTTIQKVDTTTAKGTTKGKHSVQPVQPFLHYLDGQKFIIMQKIYAFLIYKCQLVYYLNVAYHDSTR